MEDFFDHPYYRLNKIFLMILGNWPYQPLFMRCIMPLVWIGILVSIMIPELIRLVNVFGDVHTVIDCLPPFFVMGLSYTQLINGSLNREKITVMLERIPADWKRLNESPNIEIIHKYAQRGRYITRTYSASIFSATLIYLVVPAIPAILDIISPGSEPRKKYFLFEAEYGINNNDYYWPLLAHAYITSVVAIGVMVAGDVMVVAVVEHACGLFEIVGKNLEMMNDKILARDSDEQTNRAAISYCVRLHREAIMFAELIESSYTFYFMGIIGCSLILLSMSGAQAILHLDETELIMRSGSFCLAQILHIYFNSIPGQKVMDSSSSVFEYAYALNWYNLTPPNQKLLLLIMLRSLRPCKITAAKIYILSMESYSTVMQTAMSYFTVLSSML